MKLLSPNFLSLRSICCSIGQASHNRSRNVFFGMPLIPKFASGCRFTELFSVTLEANTLK